VSCTRGRRRLERRRLPGGSSAHRDGDSPEITHADLEVATPREQPPAGAARDELEGRRQLAKRHLARTFHVGDVAPVGHEAPAHLDLVRALADDAPQRREGAQGRAARKVGPG
jgi:hypothetical protein